MSYNVEDTRTEEDMRPWAFREDDEDDCDLAYDRAVDEMMEERE